ncbi:MAG: hypothetical protein M3Z14_07430 [Candidatus Eremiobacteraeota bacterium]|nr:hypothetical protein [Candidatus Eremiobacteraeota bacterium]
MRSLAQFFASTDPELFALSEIEPGDALALATRFVRQYAHRGGQALFLKDGMEIIDVRDEYLPIWPARPFDRRGIVAVQARYGTTLVYMLTVKLASGRDQRAAEVRHLRRMVRALQTPAILCIHLSREAVLHFPRYERVFYDRPLSERVYQSGFTVTNSTIDEAPHHGIATPITATLLSPR